MALLLCYPHTLAVVEVKVNRSCLHHVKQFLAGFLQVEAGTYSLAHLQIFSLQLSGIAMYFL